MGMVGRRFGSPSELLGRRAGRLMARTIARRDLVAEGYRQDDDDVAALLPPAGLKAEHHRVIGPVGSPLARLLVASSVS